MHIFDTSARLPQGILPIGSAALAAHYITRLVTISYGARGATSPRPRYYSPGFLPSPSAGDTVTPFPIGSVSNVRRSLWRVSHRLIASNALGALVACTSVQAQTASELQVTPETMTLGVGQRQTIFAAAYDRQGNLISSAKFAFWSSDTLVAKVGPDGTVVGVSPGLAKVEARLQGRRASLAVLITGSERGDGASRGTAPAGSVLALDPGSLVLLPGEAVAITPQGMTEDGSPIAAGKVTWKSLKPEVASVDSNGTVVGLTPGKSIIQAATSTGLMATAPVEVTPAEVVLSELIRQTGLIPAPFGLASADGDAT